MGQIGFVFRGLDFLRRVLFDFGLGGGLVLYFLFPALAILVVSPADGEGCLYRGVASFFSASLQSSGPEKMF